MLPKPDNLIRYRHLLLRDELLQSLYEFLQKALARVHRRNAGIVNAQRRRTGRFWQGRFGAVAMDEDHLAAAFRHVSLNPVRARLAAKAQDWRWSSERAHLGLGADGLTDIAPARAGFANFADLPEGLADDEAAARLRKAENVGRPVGSAAFIARLEEITSRRLRPLKRVPRVPDVVEDREIVE